jgi:predicted nucleic acid-binding protein
MEGRRAMDALRKLFTGGIPDFGSAQAQQAAQLFHATGRSGSLRIDSMIAATAILANSRLATANHEVVAAFVPFGLTLVDW